MYAIAPRSFISLITATDDGIVILSSETPTNTTVPFGFAHNMALVTAIELPQQSNTTSKPYSLCFLTLAIKFSSLALKNSSAQPSLTAFFPLNSLVSAMAT